MSTNSNAKTKRDDILRKLRALRSKTQAAGATEHEALAAASLAARLMQEWEIDEADCLANEQDAYKRNVWDFGEENYKKTNDEIVEVMDVSLAKLCKVRILLKQQYSGGYEGCVVGDRPDRELFLYLRELIVTSLDLSWFNWSLFEATLDDMPEPTRKKKGAVAGNPAEYAFKVGMRNRIDERIRELRVEREAMPTGTKALAVIGEKHDALDIFMRSQYPSLRMARSEWGRSDQAQAARAYDAGKLAGNRVALTPGMGGNQQRLS